MKNVALENELKVMRMCVEALQTLPEPGQGRVLIWLYQIFSNALPDTKEVKK